MAKVSVTPDEFKMVFFDAARITELASEIAEMVGLPADAEVRIEIDETSALGRTKVTSLAPITLSIEGGAFEDAKRPRQMSERGVRDTLARLLFRVSDRRSGRFDGAPSDEELTLPQATAWDAYAVGRAERKGVVVQKPRRLYHFRNRHGFSDVADSVFERLWAADGLSWDDIEKACAETAAAREPAA